MQRLSINSLVHFPDRGTTAVITSPTIYIKEGKVSTGIDLRVFFFCLDFHTEAMGSCHESAADDSSSSDQFTREEIDANLPFLTFQELA